MKELLSLTVGPAADERLCVLRPDRYAPYGATLLGDVEGKPMALRFNYSGLALTVTDKDLFNELERLYGAGSRSALLGRLRAIALAVVHRERDVCERLVLRAYEAGYADAQERRVCSSFSKTASENAGQFTPSKS